MNGIVNVKRFGAGSFVFVAANSNQCTSYNHIRCQIQGSSVGRTLVKQLEINYPTNTLNAYWFYSL
jgi:hypothetical protein